MKLQQELAGTGVRVQVVLPGATRTDLWDMAGIDPGTALPRNMVMDAEDMVDAALVGLDSGETVTMPSLPDLADWNAYEAARQRLASGLSGHARAALPRRNCERCWGVMPCLRHVTVAVGPSWARPR